MSKVVQGLYYSKDHEWVMKEGMAARIGITDHAQDSMGDIVYVDAGTEGAEVNAGDAVGSIESVKAASDILSPISGNVTTVNSALDSNPELLNADPYENYIYIMDMSDPTELDSLMSAEEYTAYCQEN